MILRIYICLVIIFGRIDTASHSCHSLFAFGMIVRNLLFKSGLPRLDGSLSNIFDTSIAGGMFRVEARWTTFRIESYCPSFYMSPADDFCPPVFVLWQIRKYRVMCVSIGFLRFFHLPVRRFSGFGIFFPRFPEFDAEEAFETVVHTSCWWSRNERFPRRAGRTLTRHGRTVRNGQVQNTATRPR